MPHIHLLNLYVCTPNPVKPNIYKEYIYASTDRENVNTTLLHNGIHRALDQDDVRYIYRLAVPDKHDLVADSKTGLVKVPNSTSVVYIYDGIQNNTDTILREEANVVKSLHLNHTCFCSS